jgi:TRAP-type C4-dicarboxylate transport system permease small subunit
MQATANTNRRVKQAATALRCVEEFILSASILAIAALTIANVVARNLFGASLAIAEEASQFLIITVTFVGLSYAASLGRHIRMTAIAEQLSVAARGRLEQAICASTSIFMLGLCMCAVRYVYAVYELGGVYSVTRLPFYAVYAVAPLGFGLAAIQYGLMAVAGNLGSDPAEEVAQQVAHDRCSA